MQSFIKLFRLLSVIKSGKQMYCEEIKDTIFGSILEIIEVS